MQSPTDNAIDLHARSPRTPRDRRNAWAIFPSRTRRITFAALTGLAVIGWSWNDDRSLAEESAKPAVGAPSGEVIYQAECASCHGAKGEGVADAYANPLIGDRSLGELIELIEKTMPEDDPGTCTGDNARTVASYIYDSFYSPAAQVRNQSATIDLTRLTVRQYQNTVSDLIASFQGELQRWPNERGLRGEYFRSRKQRDSDRQIERVDPIVDFDFGEKSPEEGKFEANEFTIRWTGSIIPPDSGDYEFVVRSQHSMQLWINDDEKPFIDRQVKSGNDNEQRATIRLLAGRMVPMRLFFSKALQGVNKDHEKPLPAMVSLQWVRPGGVQEPIPTTWLTPKRVQPVYVVMTPFPPDDRSLGYERGGSISKGWDQSTTQAAIETATYIVDRLERLAGDPGGDPAKREEREKKLRDFCATFTARAFRRPLTDEERAIYVDRQFEKSEHVDDAVKRSVLLTLKSPKFLFRELEESQNEPFQTASRLSYALWDSMPDEELRRAAREGRLSNVDQVRGQAWRMLDDSRTHSKIRAFFQNWLKLDPPRELAKDNAAYPGFDVGMAADLRTSLEFFVDQIFWSEPSDFRQLLVARELPFNKRLASFYGAPNVDGNDFRNVAFEADDRAGILSHPYMLSAFAYTANSSPIHRGVFISRNLLGRVLRMPPEAVAPLAAEVNPDLTTRERVALQTKAQSCMGCHGMINPLGFTLENFDAVGKLRREEHGKPIDASGGYRGRDGNSVEFRSVPELAKFLSESHETHEAFVDRLFHYVAKQPIRAYGDRRKQLQDLFVGSGYNMKGLVVEIAVDAALAKRTPVKVK